jgi:hypothetical protein
LNHIAQNKTFWSIYTHNENLACVW